jgi:hypothetical protein
MKAARKVHRITQLEAKKIKDIVERIGEPDCWKFLGVLLNLPIRNIREHYRDYMQANQAPFSITEDKLINELFEKGFTFHQMTPRFSNRTRIQLRNRYKKLHREHSKRGPVFKPILDSEFQIFAEFQKMENSSSEAPFATPNGEETHQNFFQIDFDDFDFLWMPRNNFSRFLFKFH